jgi:hypothetical protein
MSFAEFRDAFFLNQQLSRDVLRVPLMRLWPELLDVFKRTKLLAPPDESAFWAEAERLWQQWLGVPIPFDDSSWRKLAIRLELKPPEHLDKAWLDKHVLPALFARKEGPIPLMPPPKLEHSAPLATLTEPTDADRGRHQCTPTATPPAAESAHPSSTPPGDSLNQATQPSAIAPETPADRRRREYYERRQLWLRWQEEEGLTPANIRDRWNKGKKPISRGNGGVDVVKKALRKARLEKHGGRN